MSEEIPENLFEMIHRRLPTAEDKVRLLATKATLRLSDRDELWPVILTLDHYTMINQSAGRAIIKSLETLPEQMQKAVASAESAATDKADQAVANAVERGAERLTQIVVTRSRSTGDKISKRQLVVAASVGGLIAMLCLGMGAVGGYLVTTRHFHICTSSIFFTTDGHTVCFAE